MSQVNEMSIEEFHALPHGGALSIKEEIGSIVILPMDAEELHDSGYRAMDFVACNKKHEPMCRLSGCSDVLHIDGIGGFGYNWLERFNKVPKLVPPTGWSIDCLKKSGLLRLFPSSDSCDRIIVDDMALSSFQIYGHVLPHRNPRS